MNNRPKKELSLKDWDKIAVAIVITKEELEKNSQKQLKDLITQKIEFAQLSLEDELEQKGYLPKIDYNDSGIYERMFGLST